MALDLTAPKSPPAKAPAKTPQPKSTPGVKKDTATVNNGRMEICVETLSSLAGLAAVFGMHADAGLLMYHGPNIAHTAVDIAEENEKVGDVIDILGKNSAWTKIIGLGLIVGAQFAVNHGWIKNPERMAGAGVVTPETLISMSKTRLAEIEMDARRAQMEAEKKRIAMQEEYEAMEHERAKMNNVQPAGV